MRRTAAVAPKRASSRVRFVPYPPVVRKFGKINPLMRFIQQFSKASLRRLASRRMQGNERIEHVSSVRVYSDSKRGKKIYSLSTCASSTRPTFVALLSVRR
jgi:hypothetical protein